MDEFVRELLEIVSEVGLRLKEDGLPQLEKELASDVSRAINSGTPDDALFEDILSAIYRTFDKLRKIDKGAAEHLLAISLESLRAATRTKLAYANGKKVCGEKISKTGMLKAASAAAKSGTGISNFQILKMTVPQKKMFLALCGVASRHRGEYLREYVRLLNEGCSQEQAALEASKQDVDVTFDELCDLYFKDESKEHGTRNRAKVLQIINELSDYFYSYVKYTKTKYNGIVKEYRSARLVIITESFSRKKGVSPEKAYGLALRLSPHMFTNNYYGLHVEKNDLQHLLTSVCGDSPIRTNAAIKILSATSEYCSDPNSIFRRNGYRTRLATIAGMNKEEFEALDRRKQSTIKKDTIKSFCGLGIETEQIGYDKTQKVVSVNIDGLERIRQKYIKAELKPKNVKESAKKSGNPKNAKRKNILPDISQRVGQTSKRLAKG